MSSPVAPPTEVLRAKPRPWLGRLWVRILLTLILMFLISLTAWWIPRRTMVWVWWHGGSVYCNDDRARTVALLSWGDPTYGRGWWNHFSTVYRIIGWTRSDSEITRINLQDSWLTDHSLPELKRLKNLESALLQGSQLGRGLDAFQRMPSFKEIGVTMATPECLADLQRLPQLETVDIWKPQSGDIGLEALADLPQLKSLLIADSTVTPMLLTGLPELPQVETLVMQDYVPCTGDDLRHLSRLPNLKYLDLVSKRGTIDDTGLEQLSRLDRLETLALRTPWPEATDEGLEKISAMKSLKEIIVLGHQCTPEQINRLKKQLPNCKVTVN